MQVASLLQLSGAAAEARHLQSVTQQLSQATSEIQSLTNQLRSSQSEVVSYDAVMYSLSWLLFDDIFAFFHNYLIHKITFYMSNRALNSTHLTHSSVIANVRTS